MNCVIEESSLLNVFIALEGGVLGRGERGGNVRLYILVPYEFRPAPQLRFVASPTRYFSACVASFP